MNHAALNSKTTPATLDAGLRDLVAAMPIVILAKAVRAALQRRRGTTSLRPAQAH